MPKKTCLAALLFMLIFCAAGLGEETYKLPIDFSGGMKLQEKYFISDTEYQDPTIHVTVETGRHNHSDYWVATVKIADASQLRTVSANGFDNNTSIKGTALAKRVNAVLAVDGDYFCYTGNGYILRQGQLFLNQLTGDRDVLLIDEDGNFHTVTSPKENEVSDTVEGKKVINALFFGPVLVKDGKAQLNHPAYGSSYAASEPRQRMAICQSGELEYKCICCGPPARGSKGMTMNEFAEFVATMDVDTAYNLDGGDSCMLIFNGIKINDERNKSTRTISDIIYFASAYDSEKAAE